MPRTRWSILYRGPLSSCNYACDYCPFAKTKNTRAELEDDRIRLERFVSWASSRQDREIGVLFTPWGEGLIRRYYREELARLSRSPHVYRVAIQTNLSFKDTSWFDDTDLDALALWTTWHPTQSSLEDFARKCDALSARGVRYSVGVVGLRDAFDDIEALRERLSDDVYLWINAYKREPGYYNEEDLERLGQVDPLFRYNALRHPSMGATCRAGASSFTVDGDGDVRRCHFIKDVIGNIYDAHFDAALGERACVNDTCGCHIGYIHMDQLALYPVFGDGLLERIPASPVWREPALKRAQLDAVKARFPRSPLP